MSTTSKATDTPAIPETNNTSENPTTRKKPKAPKPPRAAPAAVFGALVVAVILLTLGAALGQFALVESGAMSGRSAVERLVTAVDGSTVAGWGLVAGIVMALLGLWLVFVALKPRRRTHEQVSAGADTWVTPRALAAMADDAAQDVPGVLDSSSSVHRRSGLRVRVSLESDLSPEPVCAQVRDQVTARVAELTSRTVDVRPMKGS